MVAQYTVFGRQVGSHVVCCVPTPCTRLDSRLTCPALHGHTCHYLWWRLPLLQGGQVLAAPDTPDQLAVAGRGEVHSVCLTMALQQRSRF